MNPYDDRDDVEALEDGTHLLLERTIKDPVHDYIPLSPYICAFIDTRQFQRLRHIKQLGVSYFVWPGAAHNRFEHCIGVAHLAQYMVEWLRSQQPELGITERDVRCVQLAGLCHDLGHGPWSHVWDGTFIPTVLPDAKWTHEDASEIMFDDLVEKNGIEISQDDVNFVKDLIKGVPFHSKNKIPPEKPFLFEIVANKRNGIDVDKFDYISRDTHAIGDRGNVSALKLIRSARVINGEICYDIKDANQIYEICYTRFSNHKRIYSHKTARSIEFMIIDALLAAEPTLKIANQIYDPAKFVHLTDDIMTRIEATDCPELAGSRAIFDRIRTRDLYQCVDYKTFDWDLRKLLVAQVTPARIVDAAKAKACASLNGIRAYAASPVTSPALVTSASQDSDFDCELLPDVIESLSKEHVIVDIVWLHYGMKDRNPLDFVSFYSKRRPNKSSHAVSGDFSTLIPACFAEILLRVYTKDKRYFGLVQAGYRAVIDSLNLELKGSIGHREPSSTHVIKGHDGEEPSTRPNAHDPPTPITEGPSTPRGRQAPLPEVSITPRAHHARRPSGTSVVMDGALPLGSERERATPFTNNSFTKVKLDYVPQTPTRGHRRTLTSVSGASGGRTSGNQPELSSTAIPIGNGEQSRETTPLLAHANSEPGGVAHGGGQRPLSAHLSFASEATAVLDEGPSADQMPAGGHTRQLTVPAHERERPPSSPSRTSSRRRAGTVSARASVSTASPGPLSSPSSERRRSSRRKREDGDDEAAGTMPRGGSGGRVVSSTKRKRT